MLDKQIRGDSFFDFFSGTSSVGKFFKKLNYQIFSSDILFFSYVLQRAYIVNNKELSFATLLDKNRFKNSATPLQSIVEYLNHIKPVKGFIYHNYTPSGTSHLQIPRMYFSDENGEIIDAIRQQIEFWKIENLISEDEYFVLLACLIETVPFYANISGVYAAFQKKWDLRATKKIVLRAINFVINTQDNYSFNEDSVGLLNKVKADIFYLDPPYNQRQYAPNYHLLETIAKYDNPEIKGVSGMRNYDNEKSKFCNSATALQELSTIAKNGNFNTLILSYNNEGIMQQNDIVSILSGFGNTDLIEFDYLRFKSNNNGESRHKKTIKEQLYVLQKNKK